MKDLPSQPSRSHALRILGVLLSGLTLSVAGFVMMRRSHLRQVEAQFRADAQERAVSVRHGFERGCEDVVVLRGFFEAGGEVSRQSFNAFLAPVLERHSHIQALQWLPAVTPRNRPALEAEARRVHPDFEFFRWDERGQRQVLAPDASFYAVDFVAPLRGNEVTLGFSAEALPTRQEALVRALRSGALSASGRVRLIQETGDQAGLLAMDPVMGKDGRILGVVQGVFRLGDLVHKSLAFLEPKGVSLRLLDGSASGPTALLHEEPSPLPPLAGGERSGLRLTHTFELAGRQWTVEATPALGYYALRTPAWAWVVLLAGTAFSVLLAGYVRNLLDSHSAIRTQVESRTRELAQEVESHRKDAQALRDSKARFRHLIEVMGEGVWVADTQGVATFVNQRMADLLGRQPADLVGRSLFDFMNPGDVSLARSALFGRLEGPGGQQDLRFRRRDGQDLWAIVTATSVRNDEGQAVSVLGVVTDITERRKQEQSLLQSQKLESLGVLAGGIAHDFNNLLTTILGNLNLAQLKLVEPSPATPFLAVMERTVQRATDLTRQLLAYSGKGRFMVGPLNLNRTVEEMSHLLKVSISKKVALRFQLQEALPALMGEASQIQQVVMNLVTNASEAIGDAEGIVTIRTGTQSYSRTELQRDFPGQGMEPGGFLVLEVSDTGQGMSAEVQARIFEPFFTTKFTGRGLGLSAMQGIVRGHKGGIRVYSEPGRGSTFKLAFPASQGVAPEEHVPRPGEAWAGSGTILVVDDEEGVRLVAADLLRSLGFDILLAEDGIQALERFRESRVPIRAVLMDLTMPRLDGVETFRELRKLDPRCRVVLTSGYNEQEAIQEFLGKGLAGFVQKPFHRASLIQALREALEG